MKIHFHVGDFVKLLADSGGDEPPEYGTIESIDTLNETVMIRIADDTELDESMREIPLDEIAPLTRNDRRMVQLLEDLKTIRSADKLKSITREFRRILKAEALNLHISDIEREILQYVAAGLTTKEIAHQMKGTEASIETYRVRLMRKLNVKNSAELISYAYRHRILKS